MTDIATRLDTLTPEQRRLLALRLKTRKADDGDAPAAAARDGGEYPLSFTQQRLWFIDRLDPGSPAYNMPFPLRLRGALHVPSLERAIGEIVRRHQSLRTRFPAVEGEPVQRIEPAGEFGLPVDDLTTLTINVEREEETARRVAEWAATPFDLERGPLFRARLLRLADDDHVLLGAMHHIVSDGWSMGVFWRELVTLYHAFRAGEPSPLPELPIQYADFAVWQRRWLSGERLERQVAWWREHLAGAPALLELPTDRPRPAVQSYRGAIYRFTIPADVAEPVRALAQREGATPFMAFLAAFNLLLSRWSGQDDVVVGTPVAGRTRRETEGLIGFFVNTLAVRTDLSGDPAFVELLGRVRAAALGAFAHQDVPFERLVEELQPERSFSHGPIYQAMLILQNTPDGPAEGFGEGLRLEEAPGGDGAAAKVDLTLNLIDLVDGSLAGVVEYAVDLFDVSTMERMGRQFESLLRAAAHQPDAPVSSLGMMTDAERAAILAFGAGEAVEYADPPVHHAFAEQAARTPDAAALVFGGRTMTYAELDRRANGLAHRLRGLGVGPEMRVGLHLERSPEMVVAILGVLKAGGAYLPLDPAYPAERLSYMLEDSGAAVLLTQEKLRGALPVPTGVEVLTLDGDAADIAAPPETPSIPCSLFPVPSQLAYVLYTSGSTGRPKGVAVEHAPLAAYLGWATRTYPGRSSAVHSSLSFDLTVTSLFVPLLTGGTVDLVEETDAVEMLGRRLQREEPYGMLKLTPTHLRVLGEQLREGAGGGAECLVVGGEALLGEQLEWWRARFPETVLVNEYGPTETVVGCCIDVRRLGEAGAGRIPIGRAAPNVVLYVLDARMQPVPAGIPGELYIGGAQVARGYLGRPALTAARFVPDPFSGAAGARLYRTGDRVRWTEVRECESARVRKWGGDDDSCQDAPTHALTHSRTHALDFLGRLDEQVKVRGFRIEPGEIEGALRRHPSIRDCAVVVRQDVPGDARLAAYVVGGVDADALRVHLRGTLPEYMVPAAFVALDALPLTPNGKLDRRGLPVPEYASAEERWVAPRTPVEEVLAGIWAEVLRVERVGATDAFFDLGGHSLLATRLCSAVRERLGVEVPVRAVFEHPVLESFAAEVDRLLRAGAGVEAPPIRPAERTGPLPLSFAQERLWFVDRLEPGSPVYHMPFQYLLRGPLDVDALRRAFGEIVRRHETLRTSLPFTGEHPVQVIGPATPVDLPVHDFRHLPEAERDAEEERVLREAATQPFDMARGPLFRVALVRLADDEHVLAVNLHHVISDGWSIGVLWTELSALYAAFVEGRPSPLPDLPVQYADFAVWQRGWLSGEVLEAQLGYWRRKLAGIPPLLELPTDRTRPAVQTYAGAVETLVLQGDDAEAVTALGRREGATLFMVLLAAMNVVFSRLAGQDDVVIGTPIAGRTRGETEGLIGVFLNSLALRTDLSGEPTFRELLRRVRETTLEAYAHQDLPFERILEELAPERSLSHAPLFQVMLNMQDFGGEEMSLAGLQVHNAGVGGDTVSKFDLTLYAGRSARGVEMHLDYNVALFDAARARCMVAQVASLLRQAAEDIDRPIHRYSLLTDDARALLPDPAAPLSAEWRGSVPEIFARHAARTPDALAVEDPRERWSYADLDAASTAIARRLMADGVRPGDVVAILGHRSAALVRALLGTMKAGAAFLILDPAYPPTRLAEYVRIASPTGFLPIAAAGDVPAEVAAALRETVRSTLRLGPLPPAPSPLVPRGEG
ncbi:MAG TPA: amino acid adenylation domain-containing protein, partial [Longimicrobium sp.]|nr:amino acid adenylation domain-containing protein [Longimicrobium sp.]